MIMTSGIVFGVLTVGSTLCLVFVAERKETQRHRAEKEIFRKNN